MHVSGLNIVFDLSSGQSLLVLPETHNVKPSDRKLKHSGNESHKNASFLMVCTTVNKKMLLLDHTMIVKSAL